jgi:hypothetical protein
MKADRDAWLAIAERWEHLAKMEEADSENRDETPVRRQQQQQQPPKRDDGLD